MGTLLAAVPGVVDWLGMTGRVGRLATYHMLLNLGAVAIFAVNWFARTRWSTGDDASDGARTRHGREMDLALEISALGRRRHGVARPLRRRDDAAARAIRPDDRVDIRRAPRARRDAPSAPGPLAAGQRLGRRPGEPDGATR
ncbi:MAG: hypothetical protein DMF83_19390 [Acidobacteria bacterium]|nr:MAG: hypothetical protein DMF83_19390 [Acidobacteriota bacterium]